MIKCKKCGKKVHPLEVFSGGICVNCYEKQFNKEVAKTGILPKPDFVNIFK